VAVADVVMARLDSAPEATPWYTQFLACPDCAADIAGDGGTFRCARCNYSRPFSMPLDLRPANPPPAMVTLPRALHVQAILDDVDLGRPRITYTGPGALRDSSELLSALLPHLSPGSRILDLGCGPRDQAAPFEHLGHAYVAIDNASAAADVLADAHSIPFRADTFDCVFSYAVLEHLHSPFLAVHEVSRVLRPGGVFCGTVSQGEPFHSSFFHHTGWGMISLAASSGMTLLRLWPSYDTLLSLAKMGRYPRLLRAVMRGVHSLNARVPFLAPGRLSWPRREKQLDGLYRAARL
jgi:SAM-dependent methyltransferase